jgi:putative transcriptional regulator
MPQLEDPHFFQSVTYVCEHTPQGAMGFIVNHPTQLSLTDILSSLGITHCAPKYAYQPIFSGGPANRERGFVLHRSTRKHWESSLILNDSLSITTSRDILEAIAKNKGPKDSIVTLGYACWAPGQLEQEIADNVWLCCPADPDLLFNVPIQDRWQAAALLAGVELSRMVLEVGHA